MNTLRIGSRESRLAVIQSELVAAYLRERGCEAPLVTMKTTGDKILDRSLDQIGGKGLFVKELDRALRDGRSDLSVHSCKDLPMEVPEDLPLIGFSQREDPRDVLVLPAGTTVWDRSKPVGCSSRRRMLQLRDLCPEVTFRGVRGNVLTRLDKLDRGEYGALILAAAGLKRLGLEGRISRYFAPDHQPRPPPAPEQNGPSCGSWTGAAPAPSRPLPGWRGRPSGCGASITVSRPAATGWAS